MIGKQVTVEVSFVCWQGYGRCCLLFCTSAWGNQCEDCCTTAEKGRRCQNIRSEGSVLRRKKAMRSKISVVREVYYGGKRKKVTKYP